MPILNTTPRAKPIMTKTAHFRVLNDTMMNECMNECMFVLSKKKKNQTMIPLRHQEAPGVRHQHKILGRKEGERKAQFKRGARQKVFSVSYMSIATCMILKNNTPPNYLKMIVVLCDDGWICFLPLCLSRAERKVYR